MVTKDEVEDTPQTVEGLCTLAEKLGYDDSPLLQSENCNTQALLYFLEDNPGAVEAVLAWAAENHPQVVEEEPEVDSLDREDLESDISHHLTLGKASSPDIATHIEKATGKVVDVDATDDALETLDLDDLRKLLHHLRRERARMSRLGR